MTATTQYVALPGWTSSTAVPGEDSLTARLKRWRNATTAARTVPSVSSTEVFIARRDREATNVASWIHLTIASVVDLLQVEQGWGPYGSEALKGGSVVNFLDFLARWSSYAQQAPTVSLSDNGELVAEWASEISQLEMTFPSDGDSRVLYTVELPFLEWEGPASDIETLDKWLWQSSAA